VSPRLWAIGGGTLVLLVLVIVIVARGGDATITSADAGPSTRRSTSTTTDSSEPANIATGTTPSATTTSPPSSSVLATLPQNTIDLDDEYELVIDDDEPAVVARPIPVEPDVTDTTSTTIAPPPWAVSTRITAGGHVSTDIGCADDLSQPSLDRFFAERRGPVLGWDYQHVYPLGGDRYLWLFQDTFVDHGGAASSLGQARFVHNVGALQQGRCFSLLHGGSASAPDEFEVGDGGGGTRTRWYWPMGGEVSGSNLWVFWVEMVKDPYDPDPPNGLGWHPQQTYIASYDVATLARTGFFPAPNRGVSPIYGYAVDSDDSHTYLFGNTFEQNMLREGGFWNGPHSATSIWLARVPRGQLAAAPEYRTADGWSADPAGAVPILQRFYAENPMQPRYFGGQWVAATAVDGYWGDHLAIDVADAPWGPWHTVRYEPLRARGGDPAMNTYHAHLLPWRDGYGSILISVSNNARNMARDAWPYPHRYRPTVLYAPFAPTPTTTTTTTTTSTTVPPTTSSTTSTSAPTTTDPTTSTSTTSSSTTSTTSSTTTTTTSSTTTTTTTTTTVPVSTTTTTPTTSSTSTTTSTTIAP